MKKKDSILRNGNECGDWLEEEHNILYANDLVIEFNNKIYAIDKILFRKNGNSIQINKKFIIDHTYSIDMFEKDFCKKIIQDKETNNDQVSYQVPYSTNSSDSFWKFKFKNKKLIEIQFFNPC
ncbi:hypothetical protein FY557_19905 [Chryseobacterium sp. SN22]|uniref:hypothetical protein n=1 Tax=Chryseobacterium sp. SN22 TaxID=2606431 RepID=UPI0011EC7A2D|nr:hypothetical protein [Chryseobacterium sp. SN22]KAA0125954.1 hypothetical protein FY557_19905 [Chryseobacterium sp. SN22]